MRFFNPTAFLWAALAIPIVVFYILKIRLRRTPVSTLLFWRQIFEQKQPRSIWQHLRHLLSLLVQLAMLGLLVFALAEPFFRTESQRARRLVLVVDNSASMNATDIAPSRLEEAKRQGLRIIDGLRFNDEMAILAAGTQPQVFCGLTDHQGTLRDALKAIPATDGPTRVKQAVDLARRLLADAKNRRVIVLTDGGFAEVEALAKNEDVEIHPFGAKDTANVGITRFQVRRSLIDPIGYEVLAEVVNASKEPVECRIDIDLNGNPVDVVPIELVAGGRWSQTFEKTSAEGGRLVAKLNRDDALAADNQAWAILPRRELQPVTLVTDGNLFLRKVFEAIPLVRLNVVKDAPSTPAPGITVYHRKVPKDLPTGPVFVIEPSESSDLWTAGAKLPNPIVAKQLTDSPLMAHVRLQNVTMPEARQLDFKGTAQVLASSETGAPLFALLDRPNGKVLVLTVNLDQGDLPLQTAFPIMMTNALSLFAGTRGELRESVPSGGLADLELPADAAKGREYVLRSPDPNAPARPLPPGMTKATVGPLDRCGVWTVALAPRPGQQSDSISVQEVACNLANRPESDLRTPEGLASRSARSLAGWGGRPIWYYLIATAWLLAGLEWFLYQRRWIS